MFVFKIFLNRFGIRKLLFNEVNTVRAHKCTMASDSQGVSWRGVPITEIYGSQSPWGAPEFQLVVPSVEHAVLYHIPSQGWMDDDAPPKPRAGSDVWNHDYVRMPCSSQSLYPVEDRHGETHLKKRWEIIEDALSRPIRNCKELADAILSYNTKFKSIWKFRALFKLFDEYLEEEETQYFFDVTLPEIAKLALALPKLVQAPIPLLKQNKNRSISLSQQQIASLLANAFFCTFPRRNTTKRQSEYASYPFINFNRLFNATPSDCVLEKLKCLCHYFRRVCTKVPTGTVTYSRLAGGAGPAWARSRAPLSALPVHVDAETTIEDADGLIQVDFANKYLGGGVLNTGCVQEEIRFVICPELMLSMLFTEVLRPNEAVMIIGCERFSRYSGYGGSFQWSGDARDAAPRDSSRRRRVAVLALDAAPSRGRRHEHEPAVITRDLNKAWVGISYGTEAGASSTSLQRPGLGTGNWGCGAFGGSAPLKALLQLLACAQARRPLAYFTFGDTRLRDDIAAVVQLLARANVTVGELYQYIIQYTTTDVNAVELYPYLHQVILDRKPKSPPMTTKMDTVHIEESPEVLSGSLAKEFLDGSPDLFSQSDGERGECKINMSELMDTSDVDGAGEESRQREAADAPDDTERKTNTEQHTSLFLEQMQRLDEENGKLNLSLPNMKSDTMRADFKVDQATESEDKIVLDLPTDKKKKMNKKITDYFDRKPI